MFRNALLLALGLGLFASAKPASAQIVIPRGNPNGGLEELKRAIEMQNRILIDALQQAQGGRRLDIDALLQAQGGRRFNNTTGTPRWGGVQLKKVTPDLQEKLGLPENEGLVITAVDANSVGAKAGLKKDDVLIKINKKPVPGDPTAFAKLVQDQPADQAMDLVVVREGKEETLKSAKMPAAVQGGTRRPGGALIRPLFPFPRIQLNPRPFPVQPARGQNIHIEMTVNGVKTVRDQKGNEFSGEYSREGLKITVQGKLENGVARPSEIVVQEGKETKKYAAVKDVPLQHRDALRQIMPSMLDPLMNFPAFPEFPEFPPGILPVIPGFEDF